MGTSPRDGGPTGPNDQIAGDTAVPPLHALPLSLATARDIFRDTRAASGGGRRGVSKALKAVLQCLGNGGAEMKSALEPLYHLAAALDDLDKGTVDPLFIPTRQTGGGRPPAPKAQALVKEVSSAVVSMLLDDRERFYPGRGSREVPANSLVARKLTRLGLPIAHTKVGNWRSDILAETKDGARVYHDLLDHWEGTKADKSATSWADDLLSEWLQPFIRGLR
jgi:hypothetical protein